MDSGKNLSGKCLICGNPTKIKVKSKGIFSDTCSVSCGTKLGQRKVLAANGGKHPSQTSEAKEKRKKTNFEKYGVTCVLHTATAKKAAAVAQSKKEVKDKISETHLVRYGVDRALQHESFLQKKQNTMLVKYGIKNAMHSEEMKARNTISNREGYLHNDFPKKLDFFLTLGITPEFDVLDYKGTGVSYSWKHSCGLNFQQVLKSNGQPVTCPNCHPKYKSLAQSILESFLFSCNIDFISNDRKAIKPLEIDILLQQFRLGIEVNGVYWHRDDLGRTSLKEKSNIAYCSNISLLHFWDFEVIYKLDIVKSVILAKLGKFKQRFFARKCELREITRSEANRFFDKNHLSGGVVGSSLNVALIYNHQIICAASFGKSRFKKGEYELFRFASLLDTQCIGGLSKLVSYAKKKLSIPEIITFADKRISFGKSYNKIGKYIKTTQPNYWYCVGFGESTLLISRMAAQKHKLAKLIKDFDPNLSEAQNAEKAGWIKISDCGNLKFVL